MSAVNVERLVNFAIHVNFFYQELLPSILEVLKKYNTEANAPEEVNKCFKFKLLLLLQNVCNCRTFVIYTNAFYYRSLQQVQVNFIARTFSEEAHKTGVVT